MLEESCLDALVSRETSSDVQDFRRMYIFYILLKVVFSELKAKNHSKINLLVRGTARGAKVVAVRRSRIDA
jgi:hypothetical protein